MYCFHTLESNTYISLYYVGIKYNKISINLARTNKTSDAVTPLGVQCRNWSRGWTVIVTA